MTHKIIKTDNYLLVGADDDLKRGWFYCVRTKNIFQDEGEDIHCCIGDIRIIAHLPLNGSPILEGVDLLPPYSRHQEDGLEELAQEWYDAGELTSAYSFKAGYNKAREKYKYTEEDMREIFVQGMELTEEGIAMYLKYGTRVFNNYLQSLHQYPTEFECEMEYDCCKRYVNCIGCDATGDMINLRPKTINAAQGIQWVGKYK